MHPMTRFLAATGLALLTVAGAAGSAPVALATDVAGHVYVNDNTAGVNTIAAFDRHSEARSPPCQARPSRREGAGTGTIVGSQGALQLSSDGRFLLAADAGSSQISVLRIRPDGSLRPVGSPVWSGGIEPVSIAVHGRFVYVANEGNGTTGSNDSGFKLSPGGRLVAIGGSTVPLSISANPGDILFNPTGDHLIGVKVGATLPGTFRIDSFLVGRDGRLTAASGSPFAAQAPGPFGSEFSPTAPNHLYVSNAHGGAGNGSVSAFKVAQSGALSPIGASPYADGQTAPCWVEISHNGRYLFAVDTGSTDISSYRIEADGSLTYLRSTPFKSVKVIRPFDARLDPSGRVLYVVDAALRAVSAFAVSGGSLTELAGSPFALPAAATPFGIVVTGQDSEE